MELRIDGVSDFSDDLRLMGRERSLEVAGEVLCDRARRVLEDALAHHDRGEDRIIGGEHGAALLGHQADELLAVLVTKHGPPPGAPSKAAN